MQVHPSSVLQADDDGMLPNYVVYHELIATSRPYMRNVCAVEMSWVMPILRKLEGLNVNKLRCESTHVVILANTTVYFYEVTIVILLTLA